MNNDKDMTGSSHMPRLRPGEPEVLLVLGGAARLVASAEKARVELGWAPRHTLESAIKHASAWHHARIGHDAALPSASTE